MSPWELRQVQKLGIVLLVLVCNSCAFYVPGIAPVEFTKGEAVEVKAVKMTSSRTQLPYEYYSLPFCAPKGDITYKSLNLGEVLRGDRIVSTPYNVSMRDNVDCQILCNKSITEKKAIKIMKRIKEAYSVHLLVDNLPSATKYHVVGTMETQYHDGYLLGFQRHDKVYIHNHLRMALKYHTDDGNTYRVVGFEITPMSVNRNSLQLSSTSENCKISTTHVNEIPQEINAQTRNILFTYQVIWESSKVRWASRWDIYLSMNDVHIHWFSIINSLVIVIFLSGIVSLIMVRILRRDIMKYNLDDRDEMIEESGWKLVHGDVLRPPMKFHLFSMLVGSGVQLFLMLFSTIFFAMLGMLSPASRGALMTAGICSYVAMGLFSGFFSSRLYKTFHGREWIKNAAWTALYVPGIVLGVCFLLNFFIWSEQSSGAVPFGSMLVLMLLWLGVSLPLTLLGGYFGFRKLPYEYPVKINQIARVVPPQKWYHSLWVSTMISGGLPFGALFIELFFIFTAIWDRQLYYMFGFLFIVFLIMIISISQISVVMTYFQLCSENYHWWWRCFIASGGTAIYVMAYSVFYFFVKLEITSFIPTILYFGYSFLMGFVFWILTGTIGFYASYIFILRIYAAIKIE